MIVGECLIGHCSNDVFPRVLSQVLICEERPQSWRTGGERLWGRHGEWDRMAHWIHITPQSSSGIPEGWVIGGDWERDEGGKEGRNFRSRDYSVVGCYYFRQLVCWLLNELRWGQKRCSGIEWMERSRLHPNGISITQWTIYLVFLIGILLGMSVLNVDFVCDIMGNEVEGHIIVLFCCEWGKDNWYGSGILVCFR